MIAKSRQRSSEVVRQAQARRRPAWITHHPDDNFSPQTLGTVISVRLPRHRGSKSPQAEVSRKDPPDVPVTIVAEAHDDTMTPQARRFTTINGSGSPWHDNRQCADTNEKGAWGKCKPEGCGALRRHGSAQRKNVCLANGTRICTVKDHCALHC